MPFAPGNTFVPRRPWRSATPALMLATCAAIASSPLAEEEASEGAVPGWDLLAALPASPAWDQWFGTAGEEPPPFEQVQPADVLATDRDTLVSQLEHWIYGLAPATTPILPSAVTGSLGADGGGRTRLSFATGNEGDTTVEVEFRRPVGSPSSSGRVLLLCGEADLPLAEAAERGWLALGIHLNEPLPASPPSPTPALPRWPTVTHEAWRIRRVIDHLLNHPGWSSADLALVGQGFGGKVALWTAAQDERVSAVLAVDSGPGGACPFGLWTEAEFGPGIEIVTREHPGWFSPRLRFFAGREHRLPVDSPALLACLAPRPTLIATALNNPGESAWAVEQAWRQAKPCFERTGAGSALALDVRSGQGTTSSSDWNRWLDWLESRLAGGVTGASDISGPRFPICEDWFEADAKLLNPEDFPPRGPADLLVSSEGNLITTAEDWRRQAMSVRETVRQTLGPAPVPEDRASQATGVGEDVPPKESPGSWLVRESLTIRPGLAGSVFYRTNIVGTERRLPALVWLHPWSVPTGYEAATFRKEQPWLALTRSGSVVLTFDLIGCGSRVEEGLVFHRHNPGGSLLGQMVRDARDAVSALATHRHVDPQQVFLLGCGLGGVVALHAAALDERVAGVLSVGGLPPMRAVTPGASNAALASLARQPPLLPRIAAFEDREAHLPYDFTDLLGLVAPRPTLILVPRVNRFASVEDVRVAVEAARPLYALLGNADALVLQIKDDYQHFTPDQVWCLCDDDAQR